jgi:DNA gyrase/topoisomerase IV subunit A
VKVKKLFYELIYERKYMHLIEKGDDDSECPKYIIPMIPLVLLNGCEGISTGFSTKIP